MMAKNSPCIYPNANNTITISTNNPPPPSLNIETSKDDLKPVIYKFNNSVVFEYLEVPHIAFPLDYVEVLISLCDVFALLYTNMLHEDTFKSNIVYEAMVKLDTRIKHHIINLIAKELTELSETKMRSLLSGLRSSMTDARISTLPTQGSPLR